MALRSISEVVSRQMCTGCGACAFARPDGIRMVDTAALGRRPVVSDARADADALSVCPGVGLAHGPDSIPPGAIPSLLPGWGPVLEIYEGHASDPEIRHRGSSGGAATALAAFCMERAGMAGTLHIRSRADAPHLNETTLSTSRAELMRHTGSRYAPASPCDGLSRIEAAEAPCVFIGKPCDVAATRMARARRPELDAKLGLTIAIFCAGTPSTEGTLAFLRQKGIRPEDELLAVDYRGQGWPGRFRARVRRADGSETTLEATYPESWGFLQRYRAWRCYVCADHTGEFADVAVGDPWYDGVPDDKPGSSLVVARTGRGARVVREALAAGYLDLHPVDPSLLPRSQPELLRVRGAVWGRSLGSRLLGAAAPRYRGLPLFRFWWRELDARQKVQSVFGTFRRVFRKGLRRPVRVEPLQPGPR